MENTVCAAWVFYYVHQLYTFFRLLFSLSLAQAVSESGCFFFPGLRSCHIQLVEIEMDDVGTPGAHALYPGPGARVGLARSRALHTRAPRYRSTFVGHPSAHVAAANERTNERTNENLVDADTSHTTYGDT